MDRNVKSNLLQLYKKEAAEHEMRRHADKQRQIQEERDYLQQFEKKENEADDRIRLEKMRKINENMGNYHKMLEQLPAKHKSRIDDVKINNYGYQVSGANPKTSRASSSEYQKRPIPQTQYQSQSLFQINSKTSYPEKEIDMIRRKDRLGNFLTDNVNEGDIKSYFQNQKNQQVKYYKEMLDTQCSKNNKSPPSSYLNVQNANIIKHYKRYNLAQDPYNSKRNSDFGCSTLEHNPILNPVNNIGYNRYIDISNPTNEQEPNYQQQQGQILQPQQWNDFQNNNMNNYQNNNNYRGQEQGQILQPTMQWNDYPDNNNMNNYQNNNNCQRQEKFPQNNNQNNFNNQYQPIDNQEQRFQPFPSQGNNNYLRDPTPPMTGQRLIQAGASSLHR